MSLRSLRSRNADGHCTRASLHRKLQEKWPRTPGDIVLCEPAQSKCRRTLDKSQFLFLWKFTGKMAADTSRTSFCASLRSQNAHGHVTRGIFAQIYGENAGRFRYHLDSTPGLNTYSKNPSVWTHCLGN